MRKIIKIENVFNYNSACIILRKNFIVPEEIKHNENYTRFKFFENGVLKAEYNEIKEVLYFYNYNI